MRVQACHGERGCGEMGPTTFVGMIETLEAPTSHFHTPFSNPLTFFGVAFSATLRMMFPGAVWGLWAEGFRVAAKESGVGREIDGPGAARRSLFWWYMPCRALSNAMTMM